MDTVIKGKVKKILTVILFVLIFGGALYSFRLSLIHSYFSLFYQREVSHVNNVLRVISSGEENKIKKISTEDANILEPVILSKLDKLKNAVDLDAVRVKLIYETEENNDTVMFVEGYFGEPGATFSMRFHKNQSGEWKLKLFYIADHYFDDVLFGR